jgi:hypothetical protein
MRTMVSEIVQEKKYVLIDILICVSLLTRVIYAGINLEHFFYFPCVSMSV